jgi:periplasmic divalent cation tolerance protein
VVTTSVNSEQAALDIAETLVRERLAACVQVTADVTSVYVWQGSLQRTREWICQIKTAPVRFEALRERLKALHPYEVPEILVTEIAAGDPAYLAWLAESVATP